MSTADVAAAERFVLSVARLLDRRRLDVVLSDADPGPMLDVLRRYANPDGGFGHALEPDVRAPGSETVPTHSALELLRDADALDDPAVAAAERWVSQVSLADGGVPFMLPSSDAYPHAPWMTSAPEGCHLTFGYAAAFVAAGLDTPWVATTTRWCWDRLAEPAALSGYWIPFALRFLDAVPDDPRVDDVLAALRGHVADDGTLPVAGGTEDEVLRPLAVAPRPGRRSAELFTADQVDADLDRLAGAQADDGGWTFDWAAWSPGQEVEWRGILTVDALATLRAHGRI